MMPAALLCFFLGTFGIHRFYVGKIITGILMILTLGGLGIWVLIDFVMIIVGSFPRQRWPAFAPLMPKAKPDAILCEMWDCDG